MNKPLSVLLILASVLSLSCKNEGTSILDIPNPENMYSNTKELYISAKNRVQLLDSEGNSYVYHHERCSFAGIELVEEWLFILCNNVEDSSERSLYAIDLQLPYEEAELIHIGELGQYLNPNGLALIKHDQASANATLLMTDSDYTGTGGLIELTVSLKDRTPLITNIKDIPIDNKQFPNPNGITQIGGKVYMTALGYFYEFEYEHGVIKNNRVLLSMSSILDEVVSICDDIVIVADYLLGRFHVINITNGNIVYSSPMFSYENPSALSIFDGNIMIAEKGFFRDGTTNYGNEVSQVDLDPEKLCFQE